MKEPRGTLWSAGWRTNRWAGDQPRSRSRCVATAAPAAVKCGVRDTTLAAEPRAKLSRRGLRWALEGIVVQHLTVARVSERLGVAWDTASSAVLAEGERVPIDDPSRFDGVKVIGVDEDVVRHEALLDRMEVKDLHGLAVVAVG